jgi:integrase/recombinase XerD
MMKYFFPNPKPETSALLRQGPLRPYLKLFAKALKGQGFSAGAGNKMILLIVAFGQWLKLNGIRVPEITSEHAARYKRYLIRQKRFSVNRGDGAVLRHFLDLLRREGVIKKEVVPSKSRAEQLTDEFLAYLRTERGLATSTIESRRGCVVSFLSGILTHAKVDLSALSSSYVVAFVQQQAARVSPKSAMHLTTTLRSFLRYARFQGYINNDLAAAVPAVASWSMQSIPRSLPKTQIEQVLSSCNRQTAVGRRDYAMLLLLARLGLRAGEVASLSLDDIDWQAGSITVHGKTGHRPDLPLPVDVGIGLAEYLRDGRPRLDSRAVFLSGNAPLRPIRSSVVTDVVKRQLERAGIDCPRKGAHQFRHGLATEMLREGASLAEIGELLGHRSPDTTAIYAKVDLVSLRTLAMPWPGGAK